MRVKLRRGDQGVPQKGGLVQTSACIVGVSKIGDGCVIGRASARKPGFKTPCDPVFRIGDSIKSDPWRRMS